MISQMPKIVKERQNLKILLKNASNIIHKNMSVKELNL